MNVAARAPEPGEDPVHLRTIIVEDSENDAMLLVADLEDAGYELDYVVVETEEDLRRELRSGPWDIIFSDFSMPRFNGLAAFETVRDEGVDLPFVMVSGTLGEENAVRAMRMGVTDYVLKDRRARLPAAVARALEEYRTRRMTERERDAAHQRLDAVLNRLPAVLWTTDEDLVITWIDGHGLRRTGVDPTSLVGVPISSLWADHSEVDRILPHYQKALTGEGAEFEVSYEGRHFAVQLQPTYEGRRVTGVIGVSLDVSEQIEMRRQVQTAQRMESIGRVAGGVAHDFNNLLGILLGGAELMDEELTEQAPGFVERCRQELFQLRRAGERGVGLARQLLATSRQQVQQKKPLDLGSLVRDQEDMLHRMAGDRARLTVEIEKELPPVLADPTHLGQVLMNLVINAGDAMKSPGDIVVCVDTAPTRGSGRRASDHEPKVRLRVSDSGSGMDEETLANIFEPFYSTKGDKGTGLGLATVYGIVSQSGGEIRCTSELGEGTTFEILLPPHTETPEAAEARSPAPPQPGPQEDGADRARHVLLVDDEPDLLSLYSRVLERAGYQVIRAPGEDAAFEAACAHGSVDVLVTDVSLGDGSGVSLVERVLARWPGIQVVVMSGYSNHAEELGALGDRGVHFLAKPFAPRELQREIEAATGKRGE